MSRLKARADVSFTTSHYDLACLSHCLPREIAGESSERLQRLWRRIDWGVKSLAMRKKLSFECLRVRLHSAASWLEGPSMAGTDRYRGGLVEGPRRGVEGALLSSVPRDI